MSKEGAPTISVDGSGLRVALIAASWHTQIMDGLVGGARSALERAKVTDVTQIQVPGSFELPVAAASAAHAGYDVIVALGVVIRGDTPHFDYVCSGVTHGLTDVAVQSRIPVGFGVLTVDTEEQALARAGLEGSVEDKGAEAVEAAIATVVAMRAF